MVATDFDAERAYDDEQFSAQSAFRSDRTKVVLGYFEPGQFIPVHAPDSDVAITVRRGTGVIRDGDDEHAVGPGDVVVVPAGEDRGVKAGDERLEATLVTAPPPTDAEHEPVRQGDTVDLTVENPEENTMAHNVDFHACYGPGGGADATTVAPGASARLQFKATYPGAFIYHCAVPNTDIHISAGMFGIILVEPEDGLPEVDHEFYVGQHELYTDKRAGESGHHAFDMEAMRREDPSYVLMNGEKYALTPDGYGPMTVETGDTVRVYFVTGGPNLTSSFHPIGNVWKELYPKGSFGSQTQKYIETTPVRPGTATVATMDFPVPGGVKLVDHSLTRVARKGCMAVIAAEGEEDPDIFDPEPGQ
jgi:nitrite reductase (NO-forming)